MSTTQKLNAEQVELLKTSFFARNEPNVALGNLGGMFGLPMLRGLWLYSGVDENGNAYDSSVQGRTLTNVSSLQYSTYNGLAPYAIHDGSADYLTRADEAGLDITGALTWGCWMRSNDAPAGNESLVNKWNATGNLRAYLLRLTSTPDFCCLVSLDGTAETSVTSSVTYAPDVWFHVVGRYTPSTELAIFVNGTKTVNTTSIPASLFNSSSAFRVGANGAAGEVLDGDTALPFLCAAALSDTFIQMLLYHQQRALFGRVA